MISYTKIPAFRNMPLFSGPKMTHNRRISHIPVSSIPTVLQCRARTYLECLQVGIYLNTKQSIFVVCSVGRHLGKHVWPPRAVLVKITITKTVKIKVSLEPSNMITVFVFHLYSRSNFHWSWKKKKTNIGLAPFVLNKWKYPVRWSKPATFKTILLVKAYIIINIVLRCSLLSIGLGPTQYSNSDYYKAINPSSTCNL